MTHNRECPKCGLIVEWTKTPARKEMPNGEMVTVQLCSLECPEHGEFEPRAHEQLNRNLSRVMMEARKE